MTDPQKGSIGVPNEGVGEPQKRVYSKRVPPEEIGRRKLNVGKREMADRENRTK